MEVFFNVLFCTFSLLCICISYQFYQYIRCENIFEKVQWIETKSTEVPEYNDCYSNENLAYYIIPKDNKITAYKTKRLKIEKIILCIPAEFQIDFASEQERLYVSEILEQYKKETTNSFFKETRVSLSQKHKKIYKLGELDYFMFSLLCYIEKCVQLNSYIFPSKIYEYKSKEGIYRYYNLTDFGRVCYKIYLIASMHCENTDYTKPLILNAQSSHIMECLKKNEACFWNYRP